MANIIGTVKSSNNPDISYNILKSDSPAAKTGERVYCSCPAWRYSKASPRICKHLSQWRQTLFVEATGVATAPWPNGGAQYSGRPTVKRASDRERMRSAFSQLRHLHGFSFRVEEVPVERSHATGVVGLVPWRGCDGGRDAFGCDVPKRIQCQERDELRGRDAGCVHPTGVGVSGSRGVVVTLLTFSS
jgi:hypothetical protein